MNPQEFTQSEISWSELEKAHADVDMSDARVAAFGSGSLSRVPKLA